MVTVGSPARRTFSGEAASVREARKFVRGIIDEVVDDAEQCGDIELAVSELVTNAVEHTVHEPLTVTVVVTSESIVLSVDSARTSSEIAHPTTWASPLPAMKTGRGLAIVRAVSDDVSVDADDETVTVRCSFHIG